MATAAMKSFNDVMLLPNTIKFISLRLEVRTYKKSIPTEWFSGVKYLAGIYIKIPHPTIPNTFVFYRCLEEHISDVINYPGTSEDYWKEYIGDTNKLSNDYTTAGINYGDWLVDNSLTIKQDDIDLSSSINYNSQQNVTRTLNLNIKNTIDPITLKGLQNWGADFANNRQKWWLDKRLAVFIQVRLANKPGVDYWEMPMGIFIITGLSSTHTLTNYPITSIQASSAEILYSSRRGKFNNSITIERGSNIIDGIKRILIQGGEKPENILISPDVAGDFEMDMMKDWEPNYYYNTGNFIKYIDIETNMFRFFKCIEPHLSDPATLTISNNHPITGNNSTLYWTEVSSGNLQSKDYRTVIDVSAKNWTILNPSHFSKFNNGTSNAGEDYTSYRTKYSSTKFNCIDLDQIVSFPFDLAEYTFKDLNGNLITIDLSQWNAAAFYARSSMDLYDGTFQLHFFRLGNSLPIKLNIGELVGNVTRSRVSSVNGVVNEQTEERENWRMMVIPLGFVNDLKNIYKMKLVMNKPVGNAGYSSFNFWIDDIIVSRINNVVPNPLNYTISQNRWQAIKELSDLMLCDAYYTRDGYFVLTKQHLLSPTTYIEQIRKYLNEYFGPFPLSGIGGVGISDFNLIETSTNFQFEPFYNFPTGWFSGGGGVITTTDKRKAAQILKLSTNNLYSQHLVQPGTYYGEFIINIGYINSINPTRATQLLNHIGLGANPSNYFVGLKFEDIGSGINRIIKCNLIDFLYYNVQKSTGEYNYFAVDDLFTFYIRQKNEFSAVFTIDKKGNYQVPQDDPVVTFTDLQEDWRLSADYTKKHIDKRDALYAGGTSTFDEGEMSNHIIAYGGYENDPIMGKAEGILTEDGFSLRVKGKYINERGRVRGINHMDAPAWQTNEYYMLTWSPKWLGSQFYFQDTFVKCLDQRTQAYEFYRCIQDHLSASYNEPGSDDAPDWPLYWKKALPGALLNKDTDIDRLYAGCFNATTIKEVLGQDKFLELIQQPVSNFTVEKIGDYIYHHNNGQLDSQLKWTWELMNRVIWEFKKRLSYAQKFSFQIKPYYGLDCYDIIKIHDRLLDIVGVGNEVGTGERFKIETISIPLNGNYMSITANREYRPNVGIPSFDQSHKVRWGPYFYGIDALGDNNIDYRRSAREDRQIKHSDILTMSDGTQDKSPFYSSTNRNNIGGASQLTSLIVETKEDENHREKEPEKSTYPVGNYSGTRSHFYTQHYPLKNQGGTTWVKDINSSGIGDGNQTYIILSDQTTIPYNPNIHTTNSDGAVVDENNNIISDSLKITNMTKPGRPGNYGKRPGYSLEDAVAHKGFGTIGYGLGGDNWTINKQYKIGDIVRIPHIRKNSTIETYLYFRCITNHISSLSDYYSGDKEIVVDDKLINFWQPFDTDGIAWTLGQPISITYDFYNLAFFEGEMSLEVGYAATPITDGEIQWNFMNTDDIDLMRPYKYKVSSGKWVLSNSQEPGFASANWNTASAGTNLLSESITPFNSILTSEPSQELNNFLTMALAEASEENTLEPLEFKANNPLIFEAPKIDGYQLDQSFNTYVYDVNQSNEPEHHIVRYKSEAKGTIVVRHIWIFNGAEVLITQNEIYNNIHQHNALALITTKWSRITEKDMYNIRIEQDKEIQTFTFEYVPLSDWTITNNFHGKAIKPVLIDENNIPILTPENPVLLTDLNNFAWIDGNRINICGAPVVRANYIIYGVYENIDNSMCSIAVRHRNGDFGHFFPPADLSSIKFYEQIYPYIERDQVTRVCGFIFIHDNPIDAFVL